MQIHSCPSHTPPPITPGMEDHRAAMFADARAVGAKARELGVPIEDVLLEIFHGMRPDFVPGIVWDAELERHVIKYIEITRGEPESPLFPVPPTTRNFYFVKGDNLVKAAFVAMGGVLKDVAAAHGMRMVSKHTLYTSKSGVMAGNVVEEGWDESLFALKLDDGGRLAFAKSSEATDFSIPELTGHLAANENVQPEMVALIRASVQVTLHPRGDLEPWHALGDCIVRGELPAEGEVTAVRVSDGQEVEIKWATTGYTGAWGAYRPTKHVVWSMPGMRHSGCGLAMWAVHHGKVVPVHRHGGRGPLVIDRYFEMGLFFLGAHL